MTAKYAEFTEESNALDYLEKALRFIKAAADHPLAWKWVILSVHGALYGFMICTLKGTDPDNVCTTTNAGHVKLIDFREMTERNPIELVRQSSRRLRIPRVLTAEEILALLRQLAEPYHTMVLVAVCLGLRVSEIIGLQWGDFDWENRNVLVQRAVVQCRVGETKTETS